jgi:hypothetical protein
MVIATFGSAVSDGHYALMNLDPIFAIGAVAKAVPYIIGFAACGGGFVVLLITIFADKHVEAGLSCLLNGCASAKTSDGGDQASR